VAPAEAEGRWSGRQPGFPGFNVLADGSGNFALAFGSSSVLTTARWKEPMTEGEWWSSDDVMAMLKWLRPRRRRITDRKIRLFACACCRRIEQLLSDERLRQALEVAEAYADQSVDLTALKASLRMVRAAWKRRLAESEEAEAIWKATQTSRDPAARRAAAADFHGKFAAVIAAAAMLGVVATKPSLGRYTPPTYRAAAAAEQAALQAWVLGGGEEGGGSESGKAAYVTEWRAQADMVRDLFGFLFHRVGEDPAWRKWRDGSVVRLARTIYEGRRFDQLPVLADALEAAGCAETELLGHLRSPGIHVRGCWAVDLLMGRT
jgi:hypothetical protein